MTEIRLLVSGTRDATSAHQAFIHTQLDLVCESIYKDHKEEMRADSTLSVEATRIHLIVGEARGVDSIALDWARKRGHSVTVCFAEWARLGNVGGIARNIRMLTEEMPQLVVAFPGPESKGTRHVIDQAKKLHLPIRVFELEILPPERT